MGAGASNRRAPSIHLTPDTPGVVLSLQPYEHLSLTLDVLLSHQRTLLSAISRGLYASISIKATVTEGGISRLQLHLPQIHHHHPPQPQPPPQPTPPNHPQQPAAPTPSQLVPPTALHSADFSADTRLIATPSSSFNPSELSLHLLAIDSASFHPSHYPVTLTNLSTPSLITVTAECRIDNPFTLQHDLLVLRQDHHRLAWELHAAQQHAQRLQSELHSTSHRLHSHLDEADEQRRRGSETAQAKRLSRVEHLFRHHQRRSLSCNFMAWRTTARERRAKRTSALSFLLHKNDRALLLMAWKEWRALCHRRQRALWEEKVKEKEMKVREEKLKRVKVMIALHVGRSTSAVFSAWRGYAKQRKQSRALTVEALAGKKELSRQWRVWKHWTNRVHKSRVEAAKQSLQLSHDAIHRHQREAEELRDVHQKQLAEQQRQQEERQQEERQHKGRQQNEQQPEQASQPAASVPEPAPVPDPTPVPILTPPPPPPASVLTALTPDRPTAARSSTSRSVDALLTRMVQGAVRSAFLAWRAVVQLNRQRRTRIVELMRKKQLRMTREVAFQRWRLEAKERRRVRMEREEEEKRKRSLPVIIDGLMVKSHRRLQLRLFVRWRDWRWARHEQKKDALRLMSAIRHKEEINSAWTLWRQHCQTPTPQPDDYIRTVRATHTHLPVVGLSRTLPSLPSVSSASSGSASVVPSSSVALVQGQLEELRGLYGRLFGLVQSFRGEVVKEWTAQEKLWMDQHATCRCDMCKMRQRSRGRGGVQLAWMKRYEREIEHFRYVT